MNELSNTVWVANFIFTNCTTICQPMTAEMASLQSVFKEKNLNVEFVSFTVDPTIDTPEKLKSFITDFSDDLSNWNMLTGYTQAEIRSVCKRSISNHRTKTCLIHSSHSQFKFLLDR